MTTDAQDGQQLLQQRVTDGTAVEFDHVVRVASSQAETVDAGRHAQRRAVRPGRHCRAYGDVGIDQLAGTPQRLGHDRCLQAQLGSRVDMLPGAPAAARRMARARRHDPVGRGFDDVEHLGADEVLLRLHDLDFDQFARQCPAHERHATIGDVRDCIPACRHLLGAHLDRRHRRRL